jgi:hypothetical protein
MIQTGSYEQEESSMTIIDVIPEVMPVKGSTMTDITVLGLDCLRCDENIQTREVREGEALDLLFIDVSHCCLKHNKGGATENLLS